MSSEYKILVVSQHFWPEAFRINDICDFLVEKSCSVDVLCGIPNYPKGYFFEGYSYIKNRHETHNGTRIFRSLDVPRGKNTNFRITLNYFSFPFFSLFVVPRLLARNYDKIFIYQTSPVLMSIAGIVIGKLKRVETTMYVLDLWPENLFSVLNMQNAHLRSLATILSHWHYRHVDKLIVLSEVMRDKMQEITKKPPGKIIILPQACEKIYEIKQHDKLLAARFKSGFNIVYTGNISPAQSFETIIEAAKILINNSITDINWIVVGDGMSRKWLENEVKKAKLSDSFFFEGFKAIEDIPKYADIAHAFIGCLVKSDLLEATIPAKVMSYLASGKPQVLAMDGEVADLVNNVARCGFVGPAGDSTALYNNIMKVYSLSTKARKSLGENGRRYHLQNFERNLVLGKLFNFIFK